MAKLATLVLLAAAGAVGCARSGGTLPALALATSLPLPSSDDSALCQSVSSRFVGLPSAVEPRVAVGPSVPLAGRWWIRSCEARRSGDELEIRLQGPGWYWVEATESGVSVREQVPFRLDIQLAGRVSHEIAGGVSSLWLRPAREPQVRVIGPAALEVRSENAWGWLATHVPLLSPETTAAERFSDGMEGALRDALRSGATLTYDLRSGQSDATLGQLAAGEQPRHPFADEVSWSVNERLLLAPGATQVVGPLESTESELDVVVERGNGVAYRALCVEDMEASYSAIAAGRLSQVPAARWVASGELLGHGRLVATLRPPSCRFYLVFAGVDAQDGLSAIRLRQT